MAKNYDTTCYGMCTVLELQASRMMGYFTVQYISLCVQYCIRQSEPWNIPRLYILLVNYQMHRPTVYKLYSNQTHERGHGCFEVLSVKDNLYSVQYITVH